MHRSCSAASRNCIKHINSLSPYISALVIENLCFSVRKAKINFPRWSVAVWFYYFHLRHLLGVAADACRRKDKMWAARKYMDWRIDAPQTPQQTPQPTEVVAKPDADVYYWNAHARARLTLHVHFAFFIWIRFWVAWETHCSSCSLTWASAETEETPETSCRWPFRITRLLLICFFHLLTLIIRDIKWTCGEGVIGWLLATCTTVNQSLFYFLLTSQSVVKFAWCVFKIFYQRFIF